MFVARQSKFRDQLFFFSVFFLSLNTNKLKVNGNIHVGFSFTHSKYIYAYTHTIQMFYIRHKNDNT